MIPQKFQVQGSSVASYDWKDLTSGLGYRTFYASKTQSGSHVLITRAMDSSSADFYADDGAIAEQAEANLEMDLDFDIAINVPCILRGTAYVNLSHKVVNAAGAMMHRYFVVTVYHYDGSTETSLGSETTKDCIATIDSRRELITISLTSKKFAIGHILRLNVQLWASETVEANNTIFLYFDPNSLNTLTDPFERTIGTDLIFDCPFRIDIT